MTRSGASQSTILAAAAVGLAPAVAAAVFSPGTWTIAAAAGAAVAIAMLASGGLRTARDLAGAEHREQRLQSAVSSMEGRVATLEGQLREASSTDEVSGALNRRTFLTRLDEAINRDARLQKPTAFMLIDIAAFRQMNADLGRMTGDRVLRTVGRAIQASTRGTDFVGRIGGDEFAVVLGECADPRPAVDRVFVALHGETTGGERPQPIRVAVGTVRIAEPRRGVDHVELFRIAEEALRKAGPGLCSSCDYPVHADAV